MENHEHPWHDGLAWRTLLCGFVSGPVIWACISFHLLGKVVICTGNSSSFLVSFLLLSQRFYTWDNCPLGLF